jgi:hypothetical protein
MFGSAGMKSLKIVLNPQQNLVHGGFLISAALSAGAEIRFDPNVHPWVPRLEVNHRRYAVDLLDSSRVYDEMSLEHCDVYFKRGYLAADVPASHRQRVLPFGLNYACRTRLSLAKVIGLFGWRWSEGSNLRGYFLSATPEAFELPPTAAYEAKVLFQTRIWPIDEFGPLDDPHEINGYRINLCRELKKAFGKRLVGGLVPTREAQSYPDLITSVPTLPWQFAPLARKPVIGIYTRGIHGSNAFKLPEYLASSKCIVGQGLFQELPQPLGECHSVCETIAETIAECDALLSNPRRMGDIRRASWQYYRCQVRYDHRIHLLVDN